MIQRFEAFVTGISTCYKYVQRIKSMEMTEFGLKGTHVMAIFFLNHHPEGLTGAQLCQLCAEDKAAISRTVHDLQEKGCVVTEGKKYRALLKLTEQGAQIAQKVDTLIAQWVGLGGDGLTEEERAVFYSALSRIAENLREKADQNV